MRPSIIHETLTADSPLAGLMGTTAPIQNRIYELQSLDARPQVGSGFFIVIDMQETTMGTPDRFGPQIMQIWVHTSVDSPDYGAITDILNRIDKLIMPLELVTGNDGIRLTQIQRHGRSQNTIDPGWKTATRNGLYGVLYNESGD